MPCYHPSRVDVVRRSLVGSGVADRVTVRCGRCVGCIAERSRQWAIRIVHEARVVDRAWFATLTYNDECLPAYGSLCAEDLRAFHRSMRAVCAPERFSYFSCGEYGEDTARPHYHSVLFGPEFLDRVPHVDPRRRDVWTSPTLDAAWGYGITEFSGVTFASAAYVAGYVRKKVRVADYPDHYLRCDPDTGEVVSIAEEFARMSLRPAIGRRWIERFWSDVYPADRVVLEGKVSKPPRYYDKWMDENHPDIMAEVRERRYAEAVELDVEDLRAGEVTHEARLRLFSSRGGV